MYIYIYIYEVRQKTRTQILPRCLINYLDGGKTIKTRCCENTDNGKVPGSSGKVSGKPIGKEKLDLEEKGAQEASTIRNVGR